MFKGFFAFIRQGNVIDLAVAVVIGTAFGAVINALVESVLMPLIASLVDEPDFDNLWAVTLLDGPPIRFGMLVTEVVNFLLIAAAIYFFVILPMNKMIEARNKAFGDPEEEEDENVTLLKEIRDQLKVQTEVVNPAAFASAVEAERQLEEQAQQAAEAAAKDKSVLGRAKGILWGKD
ncbi:large conductance mechanosensitive channel protein MscL [Nesterenkonia muleiensis]|uniref:large conductance mechanosensitive channel protein MscL n=1 Tax=Nesterenkonia muleiensis TaxID=2282648 RepID=UPI000E75D373